jgi:hypothetical protein
MKHERQRTGTTVSTLAAAIAAVLLTFAWAAPSEGRGGGGGGSTTPYTIVPFLPPDFASTSSYVSDVDESGHAVGDAEDENGGSQAVHFNIATSIYTSLPGGLSAQGVNNLNQIVGGTSVGGVNLALFWSSPTANPIPLPPLAGDVSSDAFAVNDDGIVVGESASGVSPKRGAVWRVLVDSNGDVQVDGPVERPPLIVGTAAQARNVNEVVDGTAWIVGNSADLAVTWTVALRTDGTLAAPSAPVPVGTLGGSWSEGAGINNFTDVSGRSATIDSTSFGAPFLRLAGQSIQPLPIPRDTVFGIAEDINDAEEIVGSIRILVRFEKGANGYGPGVEHAWLWKDGSGIDLNKQIPSKSGWDLKWATVISNDGVIGGWGNFDVYTRGFLLIPAVP